MNYLHLTRAQLSQEVYEEDVEVGGGLADAVVASRQWTVQSIEHSAQARFASWRRAGNDDR